MTTEIHYDELTKIYSSMFRVSKDFEVLTDVLLANPLEPSQVQAFKDIRRQIAAVDEPHAEWIDGIERKNPDRFTLDD